MAMAQLIERIDKLDEHRVRFVLKHPEAPFLANLAMGFASIYSAEYAAQLLAQGKSEQLNRLPVGTGPFVFERYAKDAQVRFRGNPDYWAGAPALERLIFAITPAPNGYSRAQGRPGVAGARAGFVAGRLYRHQPPPPAAGRCARAPGAQPGLRQGRLYPRAIWRSWRQPGRGALPADALGPRSRAVRLDP